MEPSKTAADSPDAQSCDHVVGYECAGCTGSGPIKASELASYPDALLGRDVDAFNFCPDCGVRLK